MTCQGDLIGNFTSKKGREKITMLTAYDFPTAALIDQCGIDVILVGDSLANVVLGLPSTKDVHIEEMLHHAKAVRRGVKEAFLVGDMPYASYQTSSIGQAVDDARRLVHEAGCAAVKVEWFENCEAVVKGIILNGIPVMGHIGLTPQTADLLGGFRVQGKDEEGAKNLMQQAKVLESSGCFGIVLECIPDLVAGWITQELAIPTIGIGAGADCDGQVLVLHDVLGLTQGNRPKFAKCYKDLGAEIVEAVKSFSSEVRQGTYPDREHSYSISKEEFRKVVTK